MYSVLKEEIFMSSTVVSYFFFSSPYKTHGQNESMAFNRPMRLYKKGKPTPDPLPKRKSSIILSQKKKAPSSRSLRFLHHFPHKKKIYNKGSLFSN